MNGLALGADGFLFGVIGIAMQVLQFLDEVFGERQIAGDGEGLVLESQFEAAEQGIAGHVVGIALASFA